VKAIELLVQSLNQWRSLWRLAFIGKQSSSSKFLESIQTYLRVIFEVLFTWFSQFKMLKEALNVLVLSFVSLIYSSCF